MRKSINTLLLILLLVVIIVAASIFILRGRPAEDSGKADAPVVTAAPPRDTDAPDPAGAVETPAATAPIVMPINTPGYSAMAALTDYSGSVISYTDAGFVYVHAGCRGRDAGAPAGVTDLKAAVRFLRFCDEALPGDAEQRGIYRAAASEHVHAALLSAGDL